MTTPAADAPPAIELVGIDKSFGPVHANANVNLVVERGLIHGIVGENGAGKSTLMSILYGFYEADRGEIRVNGEPVRIRSSREAISHGIGMVHQHFMLVPPLSVLENVMLGAEGGPLLAEGRGRDPQAAWRTRPRIRPRSRSRRHRRRIVGRPAAASRDPESAGARRRDPRARRADRGADASRGRPAVRNAARAEARGQDDHLHHPQAARDHDPDRPRVGDAARRDGRDLRHRQDLAPRARRRDGGAQGDPEDRKGPGASRRRLRSKRAISWCATIAASRASTACPSSCARARSSAWPASPATDSPSFSRRSRASARLSSGEILIEGEPIPRAEAQSAHGAAARRRARAGRSPSRRARHAVRSLRKRDARISSRAGLRQGPVLQPQRHRRRRGEEDGGFRRQAAGALAQDRQFLRRQSAEDRAGARDRAQSEDPARRSADARRRHRRDRIHPQAHRRPARRRQGGAPGLGRTRRDLRAFRPHHRALRRAHHRRAAARRDRRPGPRAPDGRASASAPHERAAEAPAGLGGCRAHSAR